MMMVCSVSRTKSQIIAQYALPSLHTHRHTLSESDIRKADGVTIAVA